MKTLFFIALVFLAIAPRAGSQTSTPIGERIWKREITNDSKAALLIAVTLHKGDDVSKQIAPFREALKTWWQKSDKSKKRDFLMTVLDEETRPEEVKKTVVKMISDDLALKLIFTQLEVADLICGTLEGKKTAEFSLAPANPPKP